MNGYCILVLCLASGILGKPADVVLEYQDSIGQVAFGYSSPNSARSEIRSADGKTRGAYSYVDGSGAIQTARYTADSENGFLIEATNLPKAPKPVQDTAEVIEARNQHFRAYEEAIKMAQLSEAEIAMRGQINQKIQMEKERESSGFLAKISKPLKLKNSEEKIGSIWEKNRDVSMVRTSFVQPGTNLNLHSQIDLRRDQAGSSPSAMSQGMRNEGIKVATQFTKDDGYAANVYTSPQSFQATIFAPFPTQYYPFSYYSYVPTYPHFY